MVRGGRMNYFYVAQVKNVTGCTEEEAKKALNLFVDNAMKAILYIDFMVNKRYPQASEDEIIEKIKNLKQEIN